MQQPTINKGQNKKKKRDEFEEYSESSFRINNDMDDIIFKPSAHFDNELEIK